MSNKLPFAWFLAVSAAVGWAAACTTDNSTAPPLDGGGSSSSSGGSSSGGREGGGSSGALRDSGASDAEGGGLGLLVDNMTAMAGTQISLQVPAGQTPGSYYTYSDYPASNDLAMMSLVLGTAQIADQMVSPAMPNPDGSQIAGELCFDGRVVGYAGLGMSLAYGMAADADASGLSSPVPFDASHYSGVSFYISVDPSDGPLPSIHFGIPDTQTADPQAWPTTTCGMVDGGKCDDDFGSDVVFTAGTWTKVAFKWVQLSQGGWGVHADALKPDQLIGMKWQANGPGAEAAAESFRFCISDIYFTP